MLAQKATLFETQEPIQPWDVKKKNLHFNYFKAICNKATYTKLGAWCNIDDVENDGKSSLQVHSIYRLPLSFFEFSKVIVSHMDTIYECYPYLGNVVAINYNAQFAQLVWEDRGS